MSFAKQRPRSLNSERAEDPSTTHRRHKRARKRNMTHTSILSAIATAGLLVALTPAAARSQATEFHIEEASISDLHRAIQNGQVTCRDIVQAYLDRAKAYNG